MIARTVPRRFLILIGGWIVHSILSSGGFCPGLGGLAAAATPKLEPGLQVTFSSSEKADATDVTVLPNLSYYVPAGASPSPFMPSGKFRAVWTGFLTLDLRSEYSFEAELNGHLKLELNGNVVLEKSSADGRLASPVVRLNKGTNALVATFQSPDAGPSFLRVQWIPKGGRANPIPDSALVHAPNTPELKRFGQLHLGRELFLEHRCVKCHARSETAADSPERAAGGGAQSLARKLEAMRRRDSPPPPLLELTMDAPTFDGIGSRRNFEWMTRWIFDPKTERASARMPRLFHGSEAKNDAEAAAAFLASLKDGASLSGKVAPATTEQGEEGKRLFDSLHCAACHTAPDAGADSDAAHIGLKHVREKFTGGSIAAFLKKPEAHYAWIQMPNFKLSDDETSQLAAYLEAKGDPPRVSDFAPDKIVIERGQKLVQTTGCLNCHSAKSENQFSTKTLADLAPSLWDRGCLAITNAPGSKAPFFGFAPEAREALQRFGTSDRSSLDRHVPAEFAERQTRLLNCRECHGKVEGFPPLEVLGGKLKPEWTKAFVSGQVTYKPRPWIEARMPAFAQRAESLANGLAMIHGYPPATPAEPAIDMEAAQIGQKLVSAAGGFACVACHAVGKVGATQVFESAGVNLAYSGERLLKRYFVRWIFNPLLIDPTTKMPVYFDEEGKSPLTDFYDGDGARQIEALWQYVRLGEKMPPPPGTENAP